MTYYAIMHADGSVIAVGDTYMEASDMAIVVSGWHMEHGSVAPYYLTTIEPKTCNICDGTGKVSDGYEDWPCAHCNGS